MLNEKDTSNTYQEVQNQTLNYSSNQTPSKPIKKIKGSKVRPIITLSPLDPSKVGISNLRKNTKRLFVYDFNESFKVLSSTKRAKVQIDGYLVNLNSQKLRALVRDYKKHTLNCECGITPSYIALEVDTSTSWSNKKSGYLSVYGLDKNGVEVEFTHDHTLARGLGGTNCVTNIKSMCEPCNNKKSAQESRIAQLRNVLLFYHLNRKYQQNHLHNEKHNKKDFVSFSNVAKLSKEYDFNKLRKDVQKSPDLILGPLTQKQAEHVDSTSYLTMTIRSMAHAFDLSIDDFIKMINKIAPRYDIDSFNINTAHYNLQQAHPQLKPDAISLIVECRPNYQIIDFLNYEKNLITMFKKIKLHKRPIYDFQKKIGEYMQSQKSVMNKDNANDTIKADRKNKLF